VEDVEDVEDVIVGGEGRGREVAAGRLMMNQPPPSLATIGRGARCEVQGAR
jgi:hypothetical protein